MEIFITYSDNSDECVPYQKVGGPVFYFWLSSFSSDWPIPQRV